MTLTRKDKLQLIGLLDGLQFHLESAIEGCIKEFIADDDPERTAKLMECKVSKEYTSLVAQDRKNWRLAEDWKIKLEKP